MSKYKLLQKVLLFLLKLNSKNKLLQISVYIESSMILKLLFIITLFYNLSFAAYEKIAIGKIDPIYKDKITAQQLYKIIIDIENKFETTLGKNIFDYSSEGKTIDILYLAPSRLEKRIERVLKNIERKRSQIESSEKYFTQNNSTINRLKDKITKEQDILNKKINQFNTYIKDVNSKKSLDKKEYEKAKKYFESQKLKLQKEIKRFDKKQSSLRREITKYNGKVSTYNYYIREYNRLARNLEELNRGFKKVRGKTLGLKTITEKTQTLSMNKIEIYGFNSLSELKAILAHEIAHLVGIPHIEKNGALMNPILQKQQIENLSLTNEDIKLFNKYF